MRASPLLCDPPANGAGGHVLPKGLCPLGGDDGGRVTHGGGDGGKLAAVVAVTNPHGLAVGKAGSGGEAHGSGRLI